MKRLNVYILNMPQRKERKVSVGREFEKKKELFKTMFVCPGTAGSNM